MCSLSLQSRTQRFIGFIMCLLFGFVCFVTVRVELAFRFMTDKNSRFLVIGIVLHSAFGVQGTKVCLAVHAGQLFYSELVLLPERTGQSA